jgi:hypothetical protein
MGAFFDELAKIAAQQRGPGPWESTTVGAPRSKLPGQQSPKAPTAPGQLSPKVIKPAPQYGKRQNYSRVNVATAPGKNPAQSAELRAAPPPNVVFGAR